MSHEGRKMLLILGGVSGVAVIVVLTTLALKLILQRDTEPTQVSLTEQQVVKVPPTAQVVSVKPHYIAASVPKRRCREEQHVVYVSQKGHTPGAGAVIGGVAGGLLGSQVGGGNGRIVSSAAGAAIGALAGNSVQNNMNKPQAHPVYTTVCSTQYVKTQIQKGYEVTYSYNGQQGVLMMDNPPMVGSVLPLPPLASNS